MGHGLKGAVIVSWFAFFAIFQAVRESPKGREERKRKGRGLGELGGEGEREERVFLLKRFCQRPVVSAPS